MLVSSFTLIWQELISISPASGLVSEEERIQVSQRVCFRQRLDQYTLLFIYFFLTGVILLLVNVHIQFLLIFILLFVVSISVVELLTQEFIFNQNDLVKSHSLLSTTWIVDLTIVTIRLFFICLVFVD